MTVMHERVILSPEDPLAWLANEWRSRPLTGILFEKGPWCPWCVHEVKQWMGQLQRLQGLGGALFIVTAQSRDMLLKVPSDWGQPEVPVICDQENVLAEKMGIAIDKTAPLPSFETIYSAYKTGVNQNGFVFFDQSGKEVIGWGAVPTDRNLGGSLDRPIPAQVVDFIGKKLHRKRRAKARAHTINNGLRLTDLEKPFLPILEDATPGTDSIELDGYEQVVNDVFDALPPDLQKLALRESRLPPDSSRLKQTSEMVQDEG